MKTGLKLSTMQILVIGFALVILIGGTLLSLPITNRGGHGIPFINGLFTATSATCVTGLAIYDTYTQFNALGQLILLILIQIGGLGFMFVMIMFSMFLGRRIGLRERSILMESVSALKIGGIVRLTKKALILTLIMEALGAVILSIRFIPEFGLWHGIWCGIFHAVSAFCNAGFDILGGIEPFGSLVPYARDGWVLITVMVLIVAGGLGFFVWDDMTVKKWHVTKYHLHSKMMLIGTLFLIFSGAVLFYFFESNETFEDMDTKGRILAALFTSVTPRTAGFAIVQVSQMSQSSTLLTMILMTIGAGPGSSGGGMKLTTFFILLLAVVARARNRTDLNIFGRRLEPGLLARASTSATLYLSLALVGTFVLCVQGFTITDSLYEALSGLGTVGLTRGITPQLPVLSRLAIILLMYAGRVGSLSVVAAMSVKKTRLSPNVKNVTERIIIG